MAAHMRGQRPAAALMRLEPLLPYPRHAALSARPQPLSGMLVLAASQLQKSAVLCVASGRAAGGCGPVEYGASASRPKSPPMGQVGSRGTAAGSCLGCPNHSGVLLWLVPTRGSRAVATNASRVMHQHPTVVVVESPTKAKKIQGFLGDKYKVLASYGHVRDLPSRDGSVRPDEDFTLEWQLVPAAAPRMAEIAGAVSDAPLLLLATDPDREGEAISWHIEQELRRRGVLQRGGHVQRITFTEITRSAVTAAILGGRQVSQPMVDAYLARRALDYLVGFHLSPVLWRKLPGAKSAGRVQSVALRLVCEREAVVERFTPTPYWSIAVDLMPATHGGTAAGLSSAVVGARLTHVDGRRLGPLDICSGEMAEEMARRIRSGPVVVSQVGSRQLQRHPAPPFTTSSLQQEASRRLGFGASKTMRIAQQLYEGAGTGEGLITYMRTDGVQLSTEAVQELRQTNATMYGRDAVPVQPRQYKGRAKNAQEAHEAIRPTHPAAITPSSLPSALDADQRALYELIWRRAVASQMTSAVYDVLTVVFSADAGSLTLRASGSLLRQPGFLRAYFDQATHEDGGDEEEEAQQRQQGVEGSLSSDEEVPLVPNNGGPAAEQLLTLQVGAALQPLSVRPCQHWTRPPARFTEASLVKALEERGIGRPSTYAPILSLLQERGYVSREGRALLPTSLGRVLTAFLEHYFPQCVDYDFTSDLEAQLDDVAGGRAAWKVVLSAFWSPFNAAVAAMSSIRTAKVYDMLDSALEGCFFRPTSSASTSASDATSPGSLLSSSTQFCIAASHTSTSTNVIDVSATVVSTPASDPRLCPKCGRGRLVLKPSRYGGFIGCSLYSDPEVVCDYARPMLRASTGDMIPASTTASDSDGEGGLQGGLTAANATERLLGSHPETGEPVWVRLGPYGLFVQLGNSLPKAPKKTRKARKKKIKKVAAQGGDGGGVEGAGDEAEAEVQAVKPKRAAVPKSKGLTLRSVTLDLALGLLALPRDLGPHPEDGLKVIANTGPFGPYVAHNGVSASLGRRASPQEVDLATAVQLLAAKRARQEARGLAHARSGKRTSSATTMAGRIAGAPVGRKVKANVTIKTPKARGAATIPSSRSKSGYTMFLQQRWQDIKAAEREQLPYRQAVSRIAAEWRALGKEGQLDFEGLAAAAERPGGAADKSAKRPVSRSAAPGTGNNASTATEATAQVVRATSPRSNNPYLRFAQQRRPELRAAHPGAGIGELSQLLGAEWRALSETQKNEYRS